MDQAQRYPCGKESNNGMIRHLLLVLTNRQMTEQCEDPGRKGDFLEENSNLFKYYD